MAYSAGTAYVSIVPDMRNFRRTLTAELRAINEELQVRVTPEVDRTAVERIRRSLSGLDTKAKVDVDTSRATQAVKTLGTVLTATTTKVTLLGAAGAQLAPQLVGALVQIAGAAALIPAAIAAAGASFAAIKIGISGVGDAFKALSAADSASAAGAKAAADKVSAAMAKLSPNAAEFVTAVHSMKGVWKDLQDSVQDALFDKLSGSIKQLAGAQLPGLKTGLTNIAGGFNQAARNVSNFLSSAQGVSDVNTLLDNTSKATGFFAQAMTPITKTFSDLMAVGSTFLPQLSKDFAGVAQKVSDFVANARQTGELGKWIQSGIDALKSLGASIGNIVSGIGGILNASEAAGSGGLLDTIESLTGALDDFINATGGQEVLTLFFTTLKQVSDALLPSITTIANVIGDVFREIAPALPPLAAAITQIVSALAPALAPLAAAIAGIAIAVAPLLVIIAQLVGMIGSYLAIAVLAIMPFIKTLADVLGTVLVAAMTALRPAFDAIVKVLVMATPILSSIAQMIGGVLVSAIQTLAPLLPLIVNAFGSILKALLPLIPPIVEFAGQLINALLPIVPPIVAAIQRIATDALIPLMAAFLPLLPVITQVVKIIIDSLSPIFPMLTDLIVSLVRDGLVPLINGLAPLLPIFVEMAAQLLGALMPILPALTGILMTLITDALLPLIPPLLDLITNLFPILGVVINIVVIAINILVPIITWLVGILVDVLVFVIQNVVVPAIQAIADIFGILGTAVGWVWKNVLQPAWDGIVVGWKLLTDAFGWYWDNILHPIFTAIGDVATWLWQNILQPVFDGIGKSFQVFGDGFAWIYHNIIEPIFGFFSDTAGKFKDTFTGIVDGIKSVWATIQDGFQKPVKFIIETVWNGGIGGFWKKADGFLGGILPDWVDAPVPFAKGGVLPGYKPGVDSIPAILSPGEAIMRPEWARAVGPQWVAQANKVAKDGPGAVKRFMSYGGEKAAQFADGGIVAGAQGWANAQSGKPYIWGGVGPNGYDCSGFMSAITNFLQNRSLYNRRFATGSFSKNTAPAGFIPGLSSAFSIGVSPDTGDGIGHMAGTLGGTNVESRGSDGVVIGGGARGADNSLFPWQFSLPQVGGGFVSGGQGGNGGGFLQWLKETFIGPAFDGLQSLVHTGVGALGLGDSPLGKVPLGIADSLINSARDAVIGSAQTVSHDETAPGSGVTRWKGVVDQALQMLNLPLSYEASTLRRMQQESSGDPNIVNTWDSNAKKGTPSKGLMQVIDPTFATFWDSRTPHDIFNPLANVVASMRYALSRYGSLPAAYDRSGGYDSGGWLKPGSTLAVNRTGVPEAILTAKQWDVASAAISNRTQGGDTFYTTTAESDPNRIASSLLRKRNFQKRAQVV